MSSPTQPATGQTLIYAQTQIGWVILGFFGAITVFSLTMLYLGRHQGPVVFAFGPLVPIFLYPTMTIRVYEDRLRFFMGPGLIGKTLPFEDITSCEAVENRWWYFWGMSYNKVGWIYNVSGFGAIAITLKNGRKYRVGSPEPEKAAAAIVQAMNQAGVPVNQNADPKDQSSLEPTAS